MPGATKKTIASAPFTLDEARQLLEAKLQQAGPKGASHATLISKATKEPRRSLLSAALEALHRERRVVMDRSSAALKYLAIEFAPTEESAAEKLERVAAAAPLELLSLPRLKKALTRHEQATLLTAALRRLESERRLLRLMHGKSVCFLHAGALCRALGVAPVPLPEAAAPGAGAAAIRQSYAALVLESGFPAVEIARLQTRSGATLAALKSWLLAENAAGRAHFSRGDWSLANEEDRAAMIERQGDRFLLVRLAPSS